MTTTTSPTGAAEASACESCSRPARVTVRMPAVVALAAGEELFTLCLRCVGPEHYPRAVALPGEEVEVQLVLDYLLLGRADAACASRDLSKASTA